MVNLNQDTFNLLFSASVENNINLRNDNIKNWYGISYELFTDAPLNTINDFWRIVAFTYSWMPTIPTINEHLINEPVELIISLQALKAGDVDTLPALLKQLIPVINNSLIGTSKVLHFIAPDYVPIIDSNVLRGWDIFFFQLHPDLNAPKLPHYKTSLSHSHIENYLSYKELLHQWSFNCERSISIREIEHLLFDLGKYTPKEKLLPIIYSLV